MKRGSFVSKARSSIAKLNEVFGCSWDDIFAKLHRDFSNRLAICCHLEKAVWIWSGRNFCVLERRSARISLPYRKVKTSWFRLVFTHILSKYFSRGWGSNLIGNVRPKTRLFPRIFTSRDWPQARRPRIKGELNQSHVYKGKSRKIKWVD